MLQFHYKSNFSHRLTTANVVFAHAMLQTRFVERNPQYAESGVYLVKFQQLQVHATCFHLV